MTISVPDGRLRLIGARIVDPATGTDRVTDLVLDGGRLVGVGQSAGSADGDTVVDLSGYVVAPGFVDLHCHLRQPGHEDCETLATGTRAAAAGGFTTVCAMADTRPSIDTGADVEGLLRLAQRDASVRVLPLGTLSKGRGGRELSEMADMAEAGAVAFSDDDRTVDSTALLRCALEYSLLVDRPIVDHAQDTSLAAGGVMHEGSLATRLGLKGVPREAEEVAVARALALARLSGGRLHLAHLSTRGAVEQVRKAREQGLRVTAEVTVQHLTLTESAIAGDASGQAYDTLSKLDPPLRSRDDADALLAGLQDGTIDAIVTDHSPWRWVDKACEFDDARCGVSAFETAFAVLMELVHAGRLDLADLVACLTSRPSEAWGLPYGRLCPGEPADLVVLDPELEWTVDRETFVSLGKNSPFHGWRLRGAVLLTVAGGSVAYQRSGWPA